MADSVLFEFLHQEMVAEFGDHDPDPSTPGGTWDPPASKGRLPREPGTAEDRLSASPQHLREMLSGQRVNLSILESLGFRVGQALGERLPQDTLVFREELDVLKFLCKDLWVAAFRKQMDGLRTNHQGTYVLQDNSFPLLLPMASGLQYREEAAKFLAFPCGILRGSLHTLGFRSSVTASVAALPACKFQVVIQKP